MLLVICYALSSTVLGTPRNLNLRKVVEARGCMKRSHPEANALPGPAISQRVFSVIEEDLDRFSFARSTMPVH